MMYYDENGELVLLMGAEAMKAFNQALIDHAKRYQDNYKQLNVSSDEQTD